MLAYNGRADFRGAERTLFNYVSSEYTNVNVLIEVATYKLRDAVVNGTFVTEAHVRVSDHTKLSVYASRLNANNYAWNFVDAYCRDDLFTLGPHSTFACDDGTTVRVDYSTVYVHTPDWDVVVGGRPVYDRLAGVRHRLDTSFAPVQNRVGYHGLIGQSYDGTGVPRIGKQDVYPARGYFVTSAMAEGAIEGVADDYRVASRFDTAFRFSVFGRTLRPGPVRGRRLSELSPCCQVCTNKNWATCEPYKFNDTTIRTAARAWCTNATSAEDTYGHISRWDVSEVTDMLGLFCADTYWSFCDSACASFNEDLSTWDTSGVWRMALLFASSSYNHALAFDTSSVQDFYGLMLNNHQFNSAVSTTFSAGVWFTYAFYQASSFDQPVTFDASSMGGNHPGAPASGTNLRYVFTGTAMQSDISILNFNFTEVDPRWFFEGFVPPEYAGAINGERKGGCCTDCRFCHALGVETVADASCPSTGHRCGHVSPSLPPSPSLAPPPA